MARSRIRTGTIAVEGLTELNKALKALGPELQKKLQTTNKSAAEIVAVAARSAMSSLGAQGEHFAPGIKASGGATSAGVALDGRRMPGVLGVEFGAKKYPQFQPWRGNQFEGGDVGYALFPTVRDRKEEIVEFYEKAIAEVIREAGLDG